MPYLYQPCLVDNVEYIENYQEGGFYPVHLGDTFQERYKIVHKLGFGGSSTVWLARDATTNTYVALKIVDADASSENHEINILQKLAEASNDGHPGRNRVIKLLDKFYVDSPNGRHLCLVLPIAGPNLRAFNERQGSTAAGRRMQAGIARRIAKKIVEAVEYLHLQGVCHGDLTSANVLLKLNASIHQWSKAQLYERVGTPVHAPVVANDGSKPDHRAPAYLVEPCSLTDITCLDEDILLVDFDCAHIITDPDVATFKTRGSTMCYAPPEVALDDKVSIYSDVWSLGAVLYEVRSGEMLIEDFLCTEDSAVSQIVQIFGKLPKTWWVSWEKRALFFDEAGASVRNKKTGEELYPPYPLARSIAEIGSRDEERIELAQRIIAGRRAEGEMISDDPPACGLEVEPFGKTVPKEEATQLEDLLQKIMRHEPDQRMTLKEALSHPWFPQESKLDGTVDQKVSTAPSDIEQGVMDAHVAETVHLTEEGVATQGDSDPTRNNEEDTTGAHKSRVPLYRRLINSLLKCLGFRRS